MTNKDFIPALQARQLSYSSESQRKIIFDEIEKVIKEAAMYGDFSVKYYSTSFENNSEFMQTIMEGLVAFGYNVKVSQESLNGIVVGW